MCQCSAAQAARCPDHACPHADRCFAGAVHLVTATAMHSCSSHGILHACRLGASGPPLLRNCFCNSPSWSIGKQRKKR